MPTSDAFADFVLAGLPEAVIVTLENGEIVHFNPASTRLLEYNSAEAVGADITLIIPPRDDRRADPLKWFERWAADPSDNEPRFLDLYATTKSGRDLPVSVRVRKDEFDGRNHFLITFRDVTDIRIREAEQRHEMLRAMRILQIAEDAIITINEDQNIIFANLKAEEMFGYGTDELSGQSIDMLLPEKARPKHEAQIQGFGASKVASKAMSGRGSIQGQCKSGDVIDLDASITNVTVDGVSTYTAHLRRCK